MLDPTAMVLADRATRRHLLSARPQAPTVPAARPGRPGRRAPAALRRLADRLESGRARPPARWPVGR
jgi:hypothetical protein